MSTKPRQRKQFDWSWLNRVALVVVVAALVAAMGMAVNSLLVVPVARVAVNGDFRQVDKQAIVRDVQPFLDAGFVKLDLVGIRERLQSHPWIERAEVMRHWPNEITIFVLEQKVIARWGDAGFLNQRGELFIPEHTNMQLLDIDRLPVLSGPEGSAELVMNHYRELNDALAQHRMALNELTLNNRGGWSARLQDGTRILFGAGDVIAKTQRFLRAYQGVLAKDYARVDTIDMRYGLGFAVSWRAGDETGSSISMR